MGITGTLVLIILGGITCFYGYKSFRILLSLWGFLIGFIVAGVLMSGNASVSPTFNLLALLPQIIAGIIGAIVFTFLHFVGIFLIGAVLGFFLVAGLGLALFGSASVTAWIGVCGIGLFGGIIGGSIAVASEKLFIIVITSLTGAYLIVLGVLLLTGDIVNFLANPLDTSLIPWWGQLARIVLAAFGFITQFGGVKNLKQELEVFWKQIEESRRKKKAGNTTPRQTIRETGEVASAGQTRNAENFVNYVADSVKQKVRSFDTGRFFRALSAQGIGIVIIVFGLFSVSYISTNARSDADGLIGMLFGTLLVAVSFFVNVSIGRGGKFTYYWLMGISIIWSVLHIMMLSSGTSTIILVIIALALVGLLAFNSHLRVHFGRIPESAKSPSKFDESL